jgi:DNA helicase-4
VVRYARRFMGAGLRGAPTLFEQGVNYRYERSFRWNGVNYRPDFTIPRPNGARGGVVIEYFGLEGDVDYDEQSAAKRRFWDTMPEWTLVEFTPADVAPGAELVADRLVAVLNREGVPSERRTDEEIWYLVRARAVDNLTKAMRTFIARTRKRGLTPDGLSELVSRHQPLTAGEAMFLDVAQSVYRDYLQHLAANGQEDFDGLLWRAVALIGKGQTRFARDKGREQGDLTALRHVLIDEFQHFSGTFHELTKGMRDAAGTVEFFCVGDDWQAINGFAGSELRFF